MSTRFAGCARLLKKLRRVLLWNLDELDVVILGHLHQVVHILLGFKDLFLIEGVILRFDESKFADRLGGDSNAIELSPCFMAL